MTARLPSWTNILVGPSQETFLLASYDLPKQSRSRPWNHNHAQIPWLFGRQRRDRDPFPRNALVVRPLKVLWREDRLQSPSEFFSFPQFGYHVCAKQERVVRLVVPTPLALSLSSLRPHCQPCCEFLITVNPNEMSLKESTSHSNLFHCKG